MNFDKMTLASFGFFSVFLVNNLILSQFIKLIKTNSLSITDIQYDYPTRDVVILKCNINDAAFVVSQV